MICRHPAFLLFISACLLFPLSLGADVVAEWKFDGTEPLTTDGVIQVEQTPSTASHESILMVKTDYKPEATEIGTGWASFLQTGYLNVAKTTHEDEQPGLVTRNTSASQSPNQGYSSYMGFRGLGKGKDGGTVCLVFSPNTDWYKIPANRTLFGTGRFPGNIYPEAGWILLGYSGPSVLNLVLGRGDGEKHLLYKSTIDSKDMELKKGRWYFVAAGWKEDAEPVLYLREMKSGGPASSPKAEIGKVEGKPLENLLEPHVSPLGVGALVADDGFNPRTTYGADARIAYAGLHNEYLAIDKMEQVFLSLGN